MLRIKIQRRLIFTVLLISVTIAIASLTVGRDIYYGSHEQGLLSFAIISLVGYLFFFLFVPVELSFVFYLTSGEDALLLNVIVVSCAMFSQSIDYIIGYWLSEKIIDQFIGRSRYKRAEQKLQKYGSISIFIFNFFPLSSPIISLAAGMLKYRFRDFLLASFVGICLKQLLITLMFM